MDLEFDQRVEALFHQAAELPPRQRGEFLKQHCTDDEVLRMVGLLLEHDTQAGVESSAGPSPPAAIPESSPVPFDLTSYEVGPYQLLRVLGEGGMGTVYEAEQDHPRRRVALKLIRPGLMTAPMMRRFEYEADVLGRLEHPGIARIYQAGVVNTPIGRQPYFAMELVQGEPLDQWVAKHNPSQRDRLKLLIEICQAVHHAHTKGVIHRDLKPANILIAGDGQPKILDFGVARATDADVQHTTLHTAPGQMVGTLPYMAPEQAAGRVNELDTSSDVYALGVIAYELLSGQMPYSLDGKALHEAVKVICENEPSRLSSIDRSLRGDIETIVGKALEKDKTRRYPTAGEFAADVKRYLDYEPITARPPSIRYQFSKFARRNKIAVGAAAAVLLVLVAGIIGTTYGLIRARQQQREADERRAEAEAVVSFLTENVLGGATPEVIPDKAVRDTIVQKMLDPVAQSVGQQFATQPLVEASVRNTLAMCYDALDNPDLGVPQATEALKIRRRIRGPMHADVAESLNTLATLLQDKGRYREAEQLFRESLDIRQHVRGDDHLETIMSLNNLGVVLELQYRYSEAESYCRRALDAYCRVLTKSHRETLTSMNALAGVLQDEENYEEAEKLDREALDGFQKLLGDNNPLTMKSSMLLGSLLWQQGKYQAAENLLSETANRAMAVLGEAHGVTLTAWNDLGLVYYDENKLDEAEKIAERVLRIRRAGIGNDSKETLDSVNNLAMVLQKQRRFSDAEPLFVEAMEGRRHLLGDSSSATMTSLNNLIMLYFDQRRYEDARPLCEQLYQHIGQAELAPVAKAVFISRVGPCLVQLKQYEHAEKPLLDAEQRLLAVGQGRSDCMRNVVWGLWQTYEHTNRPAEAARYQDEFKTLSQPASQPSTSTSAN